MELLNKYGYETETSDNYQNIIEDGSLSFDII